MCLGVLLAVGCYQSHELEPDPEATIDRETFCREITTRLCEAWTECDCALATRLDEPACAEQTSVECLEELWPADMDELIARGDIVVNAREIWRTFDGLATSRWCEGPFHEWSNREIATFRGGFVGQRSEGESCALESRRGRPRWTRIGGSSTRRSLLPNDCASADCQGVCRPWIADYAEPVDGHCEHPDFQPYATADGAPDELRMFESGGRCAMPLPEGAACTRWEECISRSCDGVCRPTRLVGDTCRYDAECEDHFCSDHETCRANDRRGPSPHFRACESTSRSVWWGDCIPGICTRTTWSFTEPW